MRHVTARAWLALPLLVLLHAPAAAGPPLIEAIKRGDTAAVRALLHKRADVNAAEADGTTALHWAVHAESRDLVTMILRAGADVSAANRYGVTPLMLASAAGSAAIVDALLEAGADPNTATAEGETVLMTAARTGSTDVAARLLARGAAVNARETWRGQSALMWAVAEHHADTVNLLIAAGADVHARSAKGFSPLLFAIRSGDTEIVKSLLGAGADVNEAAGDGTTALVLAIWNAHYELAAFLLERGADPNTDTPGGTALHAVTRTRNYEYGKVHRPAPVQTGSVSDLELAKILFQHGANPNAQIVKPLARQGSFDNNYLPLVGATSFLLAARAADPTLMRLLLEYGADPAIPTKQQVTPLMVAAGAGYVQGQSIGGERERLEAVKLLLDLGADVHAASESGETAMHGAATGGVNDVVQLLYDRGGKLDVKSKEGWTPLSIADGTRSNFRLWPHTAELLRKLLNGAGQQ
jgi:ankyrin repeat protein